MLYSMAAAVHGTRSRYQTCQIVLLVGLVYLVALLLILQRSDEPGHHSSIVWSLRAAPGTSSSSSSSNSLNNSAASSGCSQQPSSSQAPPAASTTTAAAAPPPLPTPQPLTAAAASASSNSWPPSLPPAPWPFPGVRGFFSESDTTISPFCNATFSKQHPLTPADYDRSYTRGGPCSMMPSDLLDALESGSREVVVTVVGGSMTHGVNCLEGHHSSCPENFRMCYNLQCSWPSKMQDRLRQLFPAGRVSVRNKARPAWGYGNWLESGEIGMLVETDVLIIDLQVNSQVYKQDQLREMEEVDLFIHNVLTAADREQRSLGVLFVESFLTGGNMTALCDAHCPEDQQGRMEYNFAGVTQPYCWCNRWWTIASIERPVVQHYQLPTVSYRDAVWPSLANPPQLLPCFWNGFSHPHAVTHWLFADVVTHGLVRSLADSRRERAAAGAASGAACQASQPRKKFHQRLRSMRYCSPPPSTTTSAAAAAAGGGGDSQQQLGTYMTPAQPTSFLPLGLTGPWSFKEDRPGKPGWIFEPGFNLLSPSSSSALESSSPLAKSLAASASTVPPVVDGSAPFAGPVAQLAVPQQQQQQAPGNVSNSLWFKVVFSSQPQLQVTYLTSYRQVGVAEIAIYSSGGNAGSDAAGSAGSAALAVYQLDGRVKDRFSVPRTTVLVHPSSGVKPRSKHVEQLPNQVQQGEYVVAIRPVNGTNLQGSKFKLLGLSSC